MNIGKYILATLGIPCLIGFTGCDEGDDDSYASLQGNWVWVYEYFEGVDDGETYTHDKAYEDIRYANVIEFTGNTMVLHFNETCTNTWSTGGDGFGTFTVVDGSTILRTKYYTDGEGGTREQLTEWGYTVDGNDLTLTIPVDSEGTGLWTVSLEKYTGSFPPAEWTTALGDDSFEQNNDVTSANRLTVDASEQNHTLPDNDIDWFTFSAQSGSTYIIAAYGVTHMLLRLYTDSGDSKLTQSEGDSTRIAWTCPETGDYWFNVITYDPLVECGEYAISISTGSSPAKTEGDH